MLYRKAQILVFIVLLGWSAALSANNPYEISANADKCGKEYKRLPEIIDKYVFTGVMTEVIALHLAYFADALCYYSIGDLNNAYKSARAPGLNRMEFENWLLAEMNGDNYRLTKRTSEYLVGFLQYTLSDLGLYDREEVDGILGPKTRQAIRAYQKQHGVEPTGTISPFLLQATIASASAAHPGKMNPLFRKLDDDAFRFDPDLYIERHSDRAVALSRKFLQFRYYTEYKSQVSETGRGDKGRAYGGAVAVCGTRNQDGIVDFTFGLGSTRSNAVHKVKRIAKGWHQSCERLIVCDAGWYAAVRSGEPDFRKPVDTHLGISCGAASREEAIALARQECQEDGGRYCGSLASDCASGRTKNEDEPLAEDLNPQAATHRMANEYYQKRRCDE